MSSVITWFTRNPIAANFLMWLMLGLGFLGWFKLRKEIFPETSLNIVSIQVPYPNASPEEVEKGVCVPVEEAVQGVAGIKRVSSSASESFGNVIVEIQPHHDVRQALADIKARVDAIDNFAQEAEKPVIEEILIKSQVLSVAVSAETDERTLRKLAEKVRDDLLIYERPKDAPLPIKEPQGFMEKLTHPLTRLTAKVSRFFNDNLNGPARITQASIAGVRNYEVSIEVSEATLREHQLTLNQVADAVRASSLDLPAGSVRTDGGEVMIRTQARRYTAPEFESITVITRPDGSMVKLGELATVRDGFEDLDLSTRFDGKPAALVNIYRTGDEDALRLVELVKNYIREAPAHLPPGVSLTIWQDQSVFLEGRMDLMFSNGLQGFLLVVIVLGLFLEPRLAFYVSLGIPISVAAGLMIMPFTGISINLISLFAFILVLGVVVDDAIVIGENVHHRITTLGETPRVAAARGTAEVAVVVIFGVMVTVAAFTPMLMVHGVGGKIWENIPLVVIPVLVLSTIESKLILPAHLASLKPRKVGDKVGFISRIQQRVERGLDFLADHFYQPLIRRMVGWRYVVLAAFISIFIIAIGFVGAGFIPFRFFPVVEGDVLSAKLTMPDGVPFETTATAVRRLEAAAKQLADEHRAKDGSSIVKHMLASVGQQPFRTSFWAGPGGVSVHLGEVTLELVAGADRTIKCEELKSRWREIAGAVPGAVELVFRTNSDRGGNAIELMLKGADVPELEAASTFVKEKLATYKGITDISSSDRDGKRELKLAIKDSAEALGLRLGDVSRQVRQSFYGEEAQRLQRGRDEVKVMVRYPKAERQSLQNLATMKIRTSPGTEVPFSEVATAGEGRGYASISRDDRRRSIRVTADEDKSVAGVDSTKVNADLVATHLPEMRKRFPGVTWSYEGEQKSQRDDMRDMTVGFFVSLVMIYVLLAIPLRSYIQPFLVMSVIPFGLVGAVLGHFVLRMELSIMSMCGCIALAGMVVNESLIMVDSINRHRRQGWSLFEAAWRAPIKRFKPIMATSVTTFVGLIPIMSEQDLQAQFLVPMSVALGFGGLFATFITLCLVPSLYLIMEDLRSLFGQKWEEEREEDETVPVGGEPEVVG